MKTILTFTAVGAVTFFVFCAFSLYDQILENEHSKISDVPKIQTRTTQFLSPPVGETNLTNFTEFENTYAKLSTFLLQEQLASVNKQLQKYILKNYRELNAEELRDFNKLFRKKTVITKQLIYRKYQKVIHI